MTAKKTSFTYSTYAEKSRNNENLVICNIVTTCGGKIPLTFEKAAQKAVSVYFSKHRDKNEIKNLHGFIMFQAEKQLIMQTLEETRGNQTQAARILGINRATLRKKIDFYTNRNVN